MKKPLLLASAAAICLLASAQTAPQPQVFEGQIVARISPNGEWISNHDTNFGVITVTNLVTGEKYEYMCQEGEDKQYDAGLGNCLSNTGVVLGTSDYSGSIAGYGVKGVWYDLPIREEDTGFCSSNGITPDGKVICGNVGGVAFGADDGSIMVTPVVWYLKEDGTYGDYEALPYPNKDFLGQTPQYVTAVCISDDGKTVAGQVVSNSGMYTEPIIYTQAGDGTWSYKLVNNQQLFNPNNVEYPLYPTGEPVYPEAKNYATPEEIEAYNAAVEAFNAYTSSQPMMQDFMTEEEYAAYQAALDAWTPEVGPYPSMEEYMTSEELEAYNTAVDNFLANYPQYPELRDFMTEEERAEYYAALDAYYLASEEWYEKVDEYFAALDELTAGLPHFIFNTITLSGNARFLGLSNQAPAQFWGQQADNAIPYIFDLEAGTYVELSASQDLDLLVTYVSNDGQVLGAGPTSNRVRNAYLCKDYTAEGATFDPIQDVVKNSNNALYVWMEENMRHTYESEELDYETWEVVTVEHVDEWLTGTPYGTPDMKYIVSWEDNCWDYEKMDLGVWAFSYLLPMDYTTDSQASISASELGIKAARGGKIAFKGAVKSVVVYDINGREVFSCDAPGAEVSTGLGQGLYLIKATDAAGRTATAKAAF